MAANPAGGMGGSAVSIGSSAGGGAGMGGAIFTHGDARNLTGKLMVYCHPTRHDQELPPGTHAREEFLTFRRTA